MTKEVCIQIKAVHQALQEKEQGITCFKGNGVYYEKNNYCYIKYEQSLEENGELIPHVLKFNKSFVALTKKVPQRVVMEFVKESITLCEYITSYGRILLEIETNKMDLYREEELIVLQLEYVLFTKGDFLTMCSMDIKITPDIKNF